MADKIIAHLDMDSFFVSVERILNPSLIGKPVIVGGSPDSRGVVSCASYEARKFGVHAAMPSAQAKRICPQAEFIHGFRTSYATYSKKVGDLLTSLLPTVEQASVDEFYINYTGCSRLLGDPLPFFQMVHTRIKKEILLPCSIGIAPEKYLAKIASKQAKPNKVLMVEESQVQAFLDPLPVERLLGVGSITLEKLHQFNIKTIGQLAKLNQATLKLMFGVYGVVLYQQATGGYQSAFAPSSQRKQISHEQTFQEDIEDPQRLKNYIHLMVERLGYQLRESQMLTGLITLKIRYSDFKTETTSERFFATDDDGFLYKKAIGLLNRSLKRRIRVRLIGVSLGALAVDDGQLSLLPAPKSERIRDLYQALDRLRGKYGFHIVHAGTFGASERSEPGTS